MTARSRGSAQTRVTAPMIARMRALTDAGLSRSAVAKVVGLDFGIKPPHRRTVQGYAPLPKDSPKHAKRLTLRV